MTKTFYWVFRIRSLAHWMRGIKTYCLPNPYTSTYLDSQLRFLRQLSLLPLPQSPSPLTRLPLPPSETPLPTFTFTPTLTLEPNGTCRDRTKSLSRSFFIITLGSPCKVKLFIMFHRMHLTSK